MSTAAHINAEATIEADPNVPLIRITREFNGTPEQLFRAHTDPDLSLLGRPAEHHDEDRPFGRPQRRLVAVPGRSRRRGIRLPRLLPPSARRRSCRPSPGRACPTASRLETLRFEDLGGGRTRLVVESLCDSFEGRDAWLASGMEVGVNEGYAKLDTLIADGTV